MVEQNRDHEAAGADSLPADRFYRGTIQRLFRGRQGGIVRSLSGREIPFSFAHVIILGARRRFEDLRRGMRVGYDVGRTSRGLRVTVLRLEDCARETHK